MERLMAIAMRYPRIVLVWVAIVTVAAATQLPRLHIAISPQSLIVDGDPDHQFYEDTVATFGSDRITIVYISDPELFRPDKLAAIRPVIDAIEALPFVYKTRSLFSVPEIRVQDDLITLDPFLDQLPHSAQEKERIQVSALKNPFVRKNLLSLDGTALAINVYLKESIYTEEIDVDSHIAGAIETAIAPLSSEMEEIYQIGVPYVRSALAHEVSREQYQIVLSGFAVLLLVLALTFRRGSALAIPFITASVSVIWLLGAMAVLGIPLNVLTAVVPVLLVIIGSTEDIHLLAEYYDGISNGLGRLRAARHTARRLGLAIGLTFLTSYLGFLAVSANSISLVREFGLVASSGLAINFLLTALLVPVLLGAFGERLDASRRRRSAGIYPRVSEVLTRFILSRRRLVIALSIGTVVGCTLAASRLHVDNSILNYFPADSPVQERAATLRDKLAGIYTFQIIIDGHIDGAFEHVRYLEQIEKVQRHIAESTPFDHSISFADYLAILNSAVNDTGDPELPYEDDVVETLMLFVDARDVREYLSDDASKTSIVVRHGISESAQLHAAVKDLETFIATKIDPDLSVKITGQSVMASNAVNDLALGQIKSLSLIVLVIFLVVSLLFVTAKAGLIAVIVNAFPIVALFGVMGLAGIPLDSATSMIAAIAVGVGVDHTMHFMVRYNQNFHGSADELTAVARTISDEAKPIGTATLALAAGFGALALSSFPPVYFFGTLSAMMMVFAFLTTFVLAPVLLSYVRLMTIWDVLGANVRKELYRQSPLFQGMRPLQIRRVIVLGSVSHFRDGEPIMQRGETGQSMFVLLRGKVTIESSNADGSSDRIKVASVGEVFGLAALMCGKPRVATATAIGNVELLSLDWVRLQRIARLFPRSAYHLFKNLSVIMGERLTRQSPISVNSPITTPVGPSSEGISEQGASIVRIPSSESPS